MTDDTDESTVPIYPNTRVPPAETSDEDDDHPIVPWTRSEPATR